MVIANGENDMDKNEVLKILETAKDENGEVPMRLVRQAFEKLPEPCENTISRQGAIDALKDSYYKYGRFAKFEELVRVIRELPSAQPEQSLYIQDILDYLDTVLHPIVSPEHWDVYSELHDMISTLPSAHPDLSGYSDRLWKAAYERGKAEAQAEIIKCRDCKYWQDQEEGVVEVPICARPENKYEKFPLVMLIDGDGFCSYAERRTDERTDR